jgi:copper chaperone CopZ
MHSVSTNSESKAGLSDLRSNWSVDLVVNGMTCAQCPAFVEKWLRGYPGVVGVTVDPDTAVASIDIRPQETRLRSLVNLLRSAGYLPGTATIRVPAKGLDPAPSEFRLEAELDGVQGILSATANPAAKTIDVRCNPEKIDCGELLRRVARLALPEAQRRPAQ